MPSLTLKDVPEPLLERLRLRASEDHRSLSREAIWLLAQALESKDDTATRLRVEAEAQGKAWASLAGRWQGSAEDMEDIVADIYRSRSPGREYSL
jgi:plasmid stability protein